MKKHKEFGSIILTLAFFLTSLFGLLLSKVAGFHLWIPISFYILLDIGYVISLIVGLRSTNRIVKIFSVVSNILFIIPTSLILFLLLFAQGISEV